LPLVSTWPTILERALQEAGCWTPRHNPPSRKAGWSQISETRGG
jgi:hypothetical protein